MLAVVIVSAVALCIGVLAEQRHPVGAKQASGRLLEAVVYFVMPVVVFFTVISIRPNGSLAAGIAYGWAERLTVIALAWLVGTKLLKLSRPAIGALIACVAIANTGYLGIPLTAMLLGSSKISDAVIYENLVNVPVVLMIGFAVGAAYGTKAGRSTRERVRSFFVKNPPLFALLAALIVPHSAAPSWGTSLAHTLAIGIAPIGFFALGVNLMLESEEDGVRLFPPPFTPAVASAVALRLLVAPVLMIGLSTIVYSVPDAFLLESAMPAGINALVVAHMYGLDMKVTVGALTWSTGIVVAAATLAGATGVF